jgi:hypothetical protein
MTVGLPSLSLRASEGSEAISSPKFGDCFVASAASLPSLLAMTSGEGVSVDVGEGVFVVAVAVGVGVFVAVGGGVGVGVSVRVGVGVGVGDGVSVGKGVCVGVGVAVGEGVAALVGEAVGVVAIAVGWRRPRAEGGPSSISRSGPPPMKQAVGSLQSAPSRVTTY